MKNAKLEKVLKIFLITILILIGLVFLISMSFCIGTKIQDIALRGSNSDYNFEGFAIVFVVCLIYSSIFYGVLFIASIVLLIIAIKKASKYKKWFIITSISPFILEIIFVLMGGNLLNFFSIFRFLLFSCIIYLHMTKRKNKWKTTFNNIHNLN